MSMKIISFLFITMLLICSALKLKKSTEEITSKDISAEFLETDKCDGSILKSRKNCDDGTTRCCLTLTEKCGLYEYSYNVYKYVCVSK